MDCEHADSLSSLDYGLSEDSKKIYRFIEEVYARGNFAEGTLRSAFRTYHKMSSKSYRGDKPKRLRVDKQKQLACFAIYATLSEAGTPRSMAELSYFTGVHISKIWKIEKHENVSVLDCCENFVERICNMIKLPYQDQCKIKNLVAKLSGPCGCRVNTLIAAVIWLYSNDVICLCLSLKEICKACHVTTSSVYKLLKKINVNVRENILSLLN